MLKEDDFGKIFFILGQTFKNRQILHCILHKLYIDYKPLPVGFIRTQFQLPLLIIQLKQNWYSKLLYFLNNKQLMVHAFLFAQVLTAIERDARC